MENNCLKKIINIINNPINDNITSILNPSEKNYLVKLFNKDNSILLQLENLLSEILSDNKIDYHDIPNIILFITKLYTNSFCIYNNKIDPFNIIQFITEAIIFSYMPTINAEEIFIINKTIYVSLQLLKIQPIAFKCNCNFLCCKRSQTQKI